MPSRSRDPLHGQAREQWDLLHGSGAPLHTSIPVIIETFTSLDSNASRDVALVWKEAIHKPHLVKVLPCELRDLQQSWEYFAGATCTSCRLSMPAALRSCDACGSGLPTPSITISPLLASG
jgi:hypothetical protein